MKTFAYTYSAKQEEELDAIVDKYTPATEQENKMDRIRQLDRQASQKAMTTALCLGISGMMILGIGMCLCMVLQDFWMVPGIVIGMIGIVIAAIAYPMYRRVEMREHDRVAAEILKLANEVKGNA